MDRGVESFCPFFFSGCAEGLAYMFFSCQKQPEIIAFPIFPANTEPFSRALCLYYCNHDCDPHGKEECA